MAYNADDRFGKQRRDALNNYEAAKRVGDVDEELAPLLDIINSLDDYYTTSSCAGRMVLLMEGESKRECEFLGKWHRQVTVGEVRDALASAAGAAATVWFRQEPPIIHVGCRSIEAADKLMHAAREAGFKRTGAHALKPGRIVVEVLSTERVETPVMEAERILVDDGYLNYLIDAANKKLMRGQRKLARFQELLKEL